MTHRTLIVASSNPHKIAEFRAILDRGRWTVRSLADVGFTDEIPETGTTFAENSTQKVTAIADGHPDAWIVADDSGLCIDCLDGRPGIHSARFMGDADYPTKIAHLSAEATHASPDPAGRTAHFHCAIALKPPGTSEVRIFEARWSGLLIDRPRGDGGFGYDPALYLPDYDRTVAELPPELKNRLSHRGQALRKMEAWLIAEGLIDPAEHTDSDTAPTEEPTR